MTAPDQPPTDATLRRRSLLTSLATALPAVALAQGAASQGPASLTATARADEGPAPAPAPAQEPCQFINPQERRTLEALTGRIIPTDELGPGAVEAGVVTFLDRQLAGAWGAGAHFYKSGPFTEGTAQQGYQLPLAPAELFREGLRLMDAAVAKRFGHGFADCAPAEQDAVIADMHEGRLDMAPVASNLFIGAVVDSTVEGYFSDPMYGGNKGMVGWKLVGFPGAYDSYAQEIERHGLEWRRPPVPMQADADLAMNPGMAAPICVTR